MSRSPQVLPPLHEPAAPPLGHPWRSLSPGAAAAIAALWAVALSIVNLIAHPTPFYTVETDLVGEYLPAASEWLRGVVDIAHYAFKGPGYPLMLALGALPLGGDVALAAKLVSPLAAGVAAWLGFLLARRATTPAIATFTLFALLASPSLVRYAIEAGTDAPALALMLGSTLLLLRGGGTALLWAGLLAGTALLTRGNALFLLPCATVALLVRPQLLRSLLAYALGAGVPLAAWAAIAARSGGLPADRNYLNVAWELYGHGVPWDQFEASVGPRFHSMLDVLRLDPLRAALHIARNVAAYRLRDLLELMPLWIGIGAIPGLVVLAREPRARDAAVERFRAEALLATGQLDHAAQACANAMRLSPATAWDWNQLGLVRARQQQYAAARDAFVKAIEIEPANLSMLELLGRTQVNLEEYAAAVATFERCVRLAPADAEARRFAIAACQLAGDDARARQLFVDGVAAGIAPAVLMGAP